MSRAIPLCALLLFSACAPSKISEVSLPVSSDIQHESPSRPTLRSDSVATHSAAFSWPKIEPAPQDLKLRASATGSGEIIESRVPVAATSGVVDGLKSDTEYQFELVSFEPEVVVASVVSRTKEPKADNVRVSAVGAHTARLEWDDRSDVEKEYRIMSVDVSGGAGRQEPGNVIGVVPANSISFTATGLEPGHQYEMWVVAIEDGDVARSSSRVDVATRTVSSEAPAALDVEQLSSAFITLRWEDKSDNEDGFILSVSGDKGATWCEQVDAVGPNVTSSILEVHSSGEPEGGDQAQEGAECSTISRLKSGNSYLFRVHSVKGEEVSAPSNELAVTIP